MSIENRVWSWCSVEKKNKVMLVNFPALTISCNGVELLWGFMLVYLIESLVEYCRLSVLHALEICTWMKGFETLAAGKPSCFYSIIENWIVFQCRKPVWTTARSFVNNCKLSSVFLLGFEYSLKYSCATISASLNLHVNKIN